MPFATTSPRRLAAGLAAATLLAGGSLAMVAPAAQATTQAVCTSAVDSKVDYEDSAGRLAATVYDYRSSNGDYTCVKLVARGIYNGMSKYMSLTVCADGNNCSTDAGTFKQYAGPINKKDFCVSVRSIMRNSAGATIVDDRIAMGSCD
ncbi:hypothetical protein OHA70_11160 [Kribbella sp. NBC_00382]|uniref:hypothetical protein n=1 Tax=Kribbella sp. NBC_00382 TaxID=2975967 RepID=UPI002E21AEF4